MKKWDINPKTCFFALLALVTKAANHNNTIMGLCEQRAKHSVLYWPVTLVTNGVWAADIFSVLKPMCFFQYKTYVVLCGSSIPSKTHQKSAIAF